MSGSIYFVRSGRFVKIGWTTKNVAARIRTIANALPEPIEVLGVRPGTRFDEARLHSRFAHCRQRGEWFTDNDDIRLAAKGVGIVTPPANVIDLAIERAGSQCALANAIGYRQPAISAVKHGQANRRVLARIEQYLARNTIARPEAQAT